MFYRDSYLFDSNQPYETSKILQDFNKMTLLMFIEEMKMIKHVFDQSPAVDSETGIEVPIFDKRINEPFTDRAGNRIFKCTSALFEELNCNRDSKTSLSIILLILTAFIADHVGV